MPGLIPRLTLALPVDALAGGGRPLRPVLVEAEQFTQPGGWMVNPQFMATGPWFTDCAGDAASGTLAGADFGVTPEGRHTVLLNVP